MKDIVIKNLSVEKPTEPYQIKVCRGVSQLGNPFALTEEKYRDDVCNKYKEWLATKLKYDTTTFNQYEIEIGRLFNVWVKYGELELFCFCAPKRCHAEAIRDELYRIRTLFFGAILN